MEWIVAGAAMTVIATVIVGMVSPRQRAANRRAGDDDGAADFAYVDGGTDADGGDPGSSDCDSGGDGGGCDGGGGGGD